MAVNLQDLNSLTGGLNPGPGSESPEFPRLTGNSQKLILNEQIFDYSCEGVVKGRSPWCFENMSQRYPGKSGEASWRRRHPSAEMGHMMTTLAMFGGIVRTLRVAL